MYFTTALEYMQLGKKIRRPTFHKNNYLYLDKHIIMSGISKERAYFCDKHFTCNDWEIIKENKTLSGKGHDNSMCAKTWDYSEEDVKKHINEFLDIVINVSGCGAFLKNKAKEIFGCDLIN